MSQVFRKQVEDFIYPCLVAGKYDTMFVLYRDKLELQEEYYVTKSRG